MKKIYKWGWHPEKYVGSPIDARYKNKITEDEMNEAKDFILGTFDYYNDDIKIGLKDNISVPCDLSVKVTDDTIDVIISTEGKFTEEDEEWLDEFIPSDTFESELGEAITQVPFIEDEKNETEYYIFIDDFSGDIEKAAKVSRLYKLVK